jgi:hypothetical protein
VNCSGALARAGVQQGLQPGDDGQQRIEVVLASRRLLDQPDRVADPLPELRLTLPEAVEQHRELSGFVGVEPIPAAVRSVGQRAFPVDRPGDDLDGVVGELNDARGVLGRVPVVDDQARERERREQHVVVVPVGVRRHVLLGRELADERVKAAELPGGVEVPPARRARVHDCVGFRAGELLGGPYTAPELHWRAACWRMELPDLVGVYVGGGDQQASRTARTMDSSGGENGASPHPRGRARPDEHDRPTSPGHTHPQPAPPATFARHPPWGAGVVGAGAQTPPFDSARAATPRVRQRSMVTGPRGRAQHKSTCPGAGSSSGSGS